MSEAQILHIINYRGLPSVTIHSSNVWYFDGVLKSNLVHHVMSLRWLSEVKDEDSKLLIIEDFIVFHAGEEKKSKFYLGRAADHSSSIRLKVMLEIFKEISAKYGNDKQKFCSLLSEEIHKTLDSCILGDTYKEAHNHGLMVDLSLIKSLDMGISTSHKKKILDLVPGRVLKQLESIFSEDGACKEHSISYQEYNLHVLHDLRNFLSVILGRYEELDHLYSKVDRIYTVVKEESRKLLGYSMVAGLYMPLGDSPSQPKEKILKKVFGHGDPEKALYPYSKKLGYYFSKSSGFFLFRGSEFSLGFTASWHSRVHKQNDDLSIVLYDKNGIPIIVDGGYSGIISDFDQRSEDYHSSFMPMSGRWKSRDISKNDFSNLSIDESGYPLSLRLVGEHNRVRDSILSRALKIGKSSIKITDFANPSTECRHRFIVPDDAEVKYDGGVGYLVVRGFKILPTVYSELVLTHIEYIFDDTLASGFAVDFLSKGEFSCEVFMLEKESSEH